MTWRQTLGVLAELGHGRDPRLGQDRQGRWANRSAYNHKTWVDIERQGQPSKWVTPVRQHRPAAAYR